MIASPAWLDDAAALAQSHRQSRNAADAWRAGEPYRALTARFDAIEPGDAEGAAAAAVGLLTDTGWLAALLAPLSAALAKDPAFEPPLRVQRDPLRIGAVLFDHPAVSIAATTLSADALARAPAPRTVVMSGRLAVVRYHRAGGAYWRCWQTRPVGADFTAAAAPPCRPLPDQLLADGAVIRRDGRVSGGMLADAHGDVTTLTATIAYAPAPMMREFAIADGALVRVATLDRAESRTEILLTLLRLSGRNDAGDRFDDASRSASFHLRWAAMREWLALDLAAALPRLRAMAESDPHDEVRAAAKVTLIVAERQVGERLAA